MGKSYKYKIGDWVEFKTYIKVSSCDGRREAHEIGLARPKFGQVCGAIVRHLGRIKSHEWDYHNDQAFLVIRKAIILYQVRDGMINIPFEVKEEDLKKIDDLDIHGAFLSSHKVLPWKKTYLSKWHKEFMSNQAKSQPRDAKGKFIRHHLRVVNQ